MKRFLRASLVVLAVAGCDRGTPPERYGFVARLGQDTVSVESVARRGDVLTSDEVDRFPRVRQRHTEVTLAPDGGIRRLVMDITTPSEPEKQRRRHVVVDVTGDSVLMTKRDDAAYTRWAFARRGSTVVAHVPQMYSLYELYFTAALGHAPAADTIPLRQVYIDREFDRFPLGHAMVRRISKDSADVWHDWLSGIGAARVDSSGSVLHYSGERTTYKVEVERLTSAPAIDSIAERFAALETKGGRVTDLSARDTTRTRIGNASFSVDYSRPSMRGRKLLGGLVPFGAVWRTGANAATQFTTSAPIDLAGIKLAAGTYTLWTLPSATGAQLIVNKQTGQWGTSYDPARDLARAAMASDSLSTPVERFTISIVASDDRRGALTMEWGPFRWTAPIVVRRD